MKILALLLALGMSLPTLGRELTAKEKAFAKRERQKIEADVANGYDRLAARTDAAIEALIQRSVKELLKAGHVAYAEDLEKDFNIHFRGYLSRGYEADYGDIGDHKPLVQFLATAYDKIEAAIGVDACKMLHLSDIKTLNFTIPIVFKPCVFDMGTVKGERKDEYRRHFAMGVVYYGLMPVIVYWGVAIPCVLVTSGIATMACGPVATAAEFACGKFVAPKLSDVLWDRACGESESDREYLLK